jgi:hypothetical protein
MADYWWTNGNDRHRLVFVEYWRRHPVSVVTEEHWDRRPWFRPGLDQAIGTCPYFWDFDYCRNYGQLYFHNSGMGGEGGCVDLGRLTDPSKPCLIWHSPELLLTKYLFRSDRRVPIRGERALRSMGYVVLKQPLLLSGNGVKSRVPFDVGDESSDSIIYCKHCRDYYPGDSLCRHMDWCNECGWYIYIDGHIREDDGAAVMHEALAETED